MQGILGAGSNSAGASVYYVANGQLAPGAEPAKCVAGQAAAEKQGEEVEEGVELEAKAIGRLCNLYVQRFDAGTGAWTKPKLIARVSAEDERDWHSQLAGSAAGTRGPMGSITSRVSPDGEFVAFMSDRNLTGYDTRDVSNGRGAEEVYSYGRAAGKLTCVSCNRSGDASPRDLRHHLLRRRDRLRDRQVADLEGPSALRPTCRAGPTTT